MTPCTHDNVGRMVPHFPRQWACLYCGQQFVSTDQDQPAPDPLRCRHCPNTGHTTEWHEAHYSVKRETWSDIYQRGRKIPAEDHPGEPHHFDAVCRRCGKPGMVNVTILAPDEIAVIQPAAQPAPDPLREAALAVVQAWDAPHVMTFDHIASMVDPMAALRAALAAPARPPCICGKPDPMAGKCFDIDGDFYPGHGYAPDPLRERIEAAYEEHGHDDDWGVRVIYLPQLLEALAAPARPDVEEEA